MSRVGSILLKVGLLVAGVALWLASRPMLHWEEQVVPLCGLAVAAILALIPMVRRLTLRAADRLAHPSRRQRRGITILIAVLAAAYFAVTAFVEHRYLRPAWQDEQSYWTQAHMLAQGHLWMPAHPMGEFFETFYLLTSRCYASIYFPGTALLHVPAVWLSLPTWLIPVCIAGAVVALAYRITCELLDGTAGLCAALMLAALAPWRMLSTMIMSTPAVALMGLLLIWALLRWRESRTWRWALAMGVFAGWGAICRPLDMVCIALPVGVTFLWLLRSMPQGRAVGQICIVLAGAAPFLALQFATDKGITGHWFQTPWQAYAHADIPGQTLGIGEFDESARPESSLPQKQLMYHRYMRPLFQRHQWGRLTWEWFAPYGRLGTTLAGAMTQSVLVILVPLGLIWSLRRERWMVGGIVLLFLALYEFSIFYQVYYVSALAPAFCILMLGGLAWLAQSGFGKAFGLLAVQLIALFSLPQAAGPRTDQLYAPQCVRAVDQWAATQIRPAVVLCHFSPQRLLDDEPVYNASVAWPDDAFVVRAHDLGAKNARLIQYYARHQPDRDFYRFDERDGSFRYLGRASELAMATAEGR